MNPEGRPKTRSLEHQMVAIYKLIHQTMIDQESKNVSKACKAVFDKAELIKFTDPALPDHQRLTDVCINPENLRKRYYLAIECSKNEQKFPILHYTVKSLSQTLDKEIERHRLWRKAHELEVEQGLHVIYQSNAPTQFARKP